MYRSPEIGGPGVVVEPHLHAPLSTAPGPYIAPFDRRRVPIDRPFLPAGLACLCYDAAMGRTALPISRSADQAG
jgi:hypothetical protein